MRVEMRLMQFPNFFSPRAGDRRQPKQKRKACGFLAFESRKRAAVSVEPDRETPGIRAPIWASPMIIASLRVACARYAWAGNRFRRA